MQRVTAMGKRNMTIVPGRCIPRTGCIILVMVAGTMMLQAQDSVRFAVIGDYGIAGQPEADVAALVQSWNPDIVITTGDNNYPNGEASTIDANIGQYYHQFIGILALSRC